MRHQHLSKKKKIHIIKQPQLKTKNQKVYNQLNGFGQILTPL